MATVESDVVAQAKAEAIRAEAWAKSEEQRIAAEADAEERRIKAEAEAKAAIIKAEEEARKQKIANDRAEARFAEEQAARDNRIAKANREREETERAAAAAAQQDEIDKQAAAESAKIVEKADKKWRGWAISFYALCAAVALPVQMSAFWNPSKPWMAGAPVLLEIAALVVAFGTAAAVANQRPHWHFRVITWVLAFIAAAVNFGHGITEFDLATAIGTALASIFGPGVWDLHEHGRLRRRDGAPTRRERNAAKAEAKRMAEKQAADKLFAAEREAHREKALREQLAKLAADRADRFPDVWDHALTLAAALGETTVTDAVWRRAHKDVKGTDPGDSPEAQNLRNAAARRMLDARADAPEKSVWKIQDAQVNPQVPPTRRRGSVTGPPVRGTRRVGDTPKFVDAARKQAAITAKSAATDTRPNDN
ncbi:hypothetical protein ACIBAC_11515 [Streptomyces sp. NPDC051362]|uniref:hypothetical protein n=1 Tax=Streptomyces sp. NPDC051362 TaxID=3365651 RepID=UPI0037969A44